MANTSTPRLCLDSVLFPCDSTCSRSPPSLTFGGDVGLDVAATRFPFGSFPSSVASGSSRPSSSQPPSCSSTSSSPSEACASSSDIVVTTCAQSKHTSRRSRSKRTKTTSIETVGPQQREPLSQGNRPPFRLGEGKTSEARLGRGVQQAAGEVRVCRWGQKGRLKGNRWVLSGRDGPTRTV